MRTRLHRSPGPSGFALATLVVGALVCPVRPALSQPTEAPRASRDRGAIASDVEDRAAAIASEISARERLQELYRRLYELQLEMREHRRSPAVRDSLQEIRQGLIEEIEQLRGEIEERRDELPGAPPPPPETPELDMLFGEIERLGEDVDWDEVNEAIERNADAIGRGLSELGRQLQGLDVELSERGVRVELNGSRVQVPISEDMKRELSREISRMGRELNRVLSDSGQTTYSRDIKVLLDRLPDDLQGGIFGREKERRERKVVAKSIFRVFEDVEIGENEMVQGDVVLVGGDAYVAGEIQGNCYLLFGDLFVEQEGAVGKDAVSLGGRVELDEDSVVHGRMFDVGAIAPGLGVGSWGSTPGFAWLVHWIRVAVLALLLFVAFAIARERIQPMTEHAAGNGMRDLLAGSFWFAVALGGFTLASVGLIISVIGIPVVLVLIVMLAAVILMAYFVGCQLLGARLLSLVGVVGGRSDWVTALVGLAVLEIPALIALGFHSAVEVDGAAALLRAIDWLLKFMVLSVGFGAAVATRLGGRSGVRAPAETLPAAPTV